MSQARKGGGARADELQVVSCGKKSAAVPEADPDTPVKTPATYDGVMGGGVGMLIVRIVAARNLPPATAGGFFSSGSSNPYCILEFEGQMHSTTVVNNTLDPVWPREQYFFEVKMPATQGESDITASLKLSGDKGGSKATLPAFSSTEPHLFVRLVHRGKDNGPVDPSVVIKPKSGAIPPGDVVLGETFVNVVDLTTARDKVIDQWFNLSEGGAVRLTVEYDVLDPVPEVGELVRLLGFGSHSDLWPLPFDKDLRVEGYADPHGEHLIVSYITSEGWKCQAEVHRFQVISAGRHQSIVTQYQERVLDAAIDFMETPLMHGLGRVLDKVEEEGLSEAGAELWSGIKKGASRWFSMGLGTAVADVKWALGKGPPPAPSPHEDGRLESPKKKAAGAAEHEHEPKKYQGDEYPYELIPAEQLERIRCPITGVPMQDPVVAADGHTYEREAIERWFSDHDTSPLTGNHLETKMVFRNYAVLGAISELRSQNEALRLGLSFEDSKNKEKVEAALAGDFSVVAASKGDGDGVTFFDGVEEGKATPPGLISRPATNVMEDPPTTQPPSHTLREKDDVKTAPSKQQPDFYDPWNVVGQHEEDFEIAKAMSLSLSSPGGGGDHDTPREPPSPSPASLAGAGYGYGDGERPGRWEGGKGRMHAVEEMFTQMSPMEAERRTGGNGFMNGVGPHDGVSEDGDGGARGGVQQEQCESGRTTARTGGLWDDVTPTPVNTLRTLDLAGEHVTADGDAEVVDDEQRQLARTSSVDVLNGMLDSVVRRVGDDQAVLNE